MRQAQHPAPFVFTEANIRRIAEKLEAREELTPMDKLMVYQLMSRKWRGVMTTPEFVTACYIVDRTVGWGKRAFTATSEAVLRGNGEYAPLGLSRTSYFKALNRLEELGMIERRSLRDTTLIAINVDWMSYHPELRPNKSEGRYFTCGNANRD